MSMSISECKHLCDHDPCGYCSEIFEEGVGVCWISNEVEDGEDDEGDVEYEVEAAVFEYAFGLVLHFFFLFFTNLISRYTYNDPTGNS
jgi:hypothetical protein